MQNNPTNLIFVEDNPQDVRLFQYALSKTKTEVAFSHYENGQVFLDALDDLYAANIACILLDINMPFIGGFEVLEKLKAHAEFKHIPVIMFTSTSSNAEKIKAYNLGANAYVVKPFELEELIECVGAIVGFWMNINARVL